MTVRTIIVLILMAHLATAQAPQQRFLAVMTYDEDNQQSLLYGGAAAGDKLFNDLWALKGSQWKKIAAGGPSERIKSAFAYDANRKRAVLFGGSGSAPLLDETWEWDGQVWKQIAISGPAARNHPMAVYDRKNKVILLFGGIGRNGLLSDTWVYDGIAWQQKATDGPKKCLPHGLVYDEQSDRVILITLSSGPDPVNASRSKNEMWEWLGDSWRKLSAGGLFTSLNSLQAMGSYGKDRIVLFDGDDSTNHRGKTWTFSAGQWRGESVQGPCPRVGHSMVHDKSGNRTLLFGGSDRRSFFNDLWEWDGKQWREITY
jgi:hypothetical protein